MGRTCWLNPGETHKGRGPLTQNRDFQYKTMISSMDKSLGYLLDILQELGYDKNTLVIFTSDNGPERGAGTVHMYMQYNSIYINNALYYYICININLIRLSAMHALPLTD